LSKPGLDDINEYHYNEIRQAVADHCNQRRGGKDIDVDININKLEIEFEKNFFIVIKKGGLVSK
jgi:frataxin-like iron-binding protein CyaY